MQLTGSMYRCPDNRPFGQLPHPEGSFCPEPVVRRGECPWSVSRRAEPFFNRGSVKVKNYLFDISEVIIIEFNSGTIKIELDNTM